MRDDGRSVFISVSLHYRHAKTAEHWERSNFWGDSITMRKQAIILGLGLLVTATTPTLAQKKYDAGASDTEIKIGQTMPYSGPLSSYSTIGRLQSAYFKMLNDKGGVGGRKINFISVDDGYSPPKTVEQIRRLVEGEGVLLTFNTMGTPTNSAIQKYMNINKVPMLFVAAGASKWNDPKHFPWTMGWPQSYHEEGLQFAQYVLRTVHNPKIAILSQNDDLGRDFVAGFKDGLGANAEKLIVKELTYQPIDPTIESQIVTLNASGANVFFDVTVSKFAAQAIRKSSELGWQPLHLLISNSSSIAGTLAVAGLGASKGLVTAITYKDVEDEQWKKDTDVAAYLDFMKSQYPQGSVNDLMNAYAYAAAHLMTRVIQQSGDDLTRENVMRQAASLKGVELPMLLPGIVINTSADDYGVLTQSRLARFDGKRWELVDEQKGK
jgi:branched-chain amino acid transport system substrate-binding protein